MNLNERKTRAEREKGGKREKARGAEPGKERSRRGKEKKKWKKAGNPGPHEPEARRPHRGGGGKKGGKEADESEINLFSSSDRLSHVPFV